MSNLLNNERLPFAAICLSLALSNIGAGLYHGLGMMPSSGFEFVCRALFYWLTGWWLYADIKKYRVSHGFDTGLFFYLAWPIIGPYHLFKTRGKRGFLTIAVFAGVYVGAYLLSVGVAYLTYFAVNR